MPVNRTSLLRYWAFILLIALAAPSGRAQGGGGIGNTTSTPVAGVPHDYITGLNEIVNPANGALSIRITREKPHERGQNWPAFDFLYDSNRQFSLVPSWGNVGSNPPTSYLAGLGFQLGSTTASPGIVTFASSLLTVCQQSGQNTCTNWTCVVQSGYSFTDSTGGQHGLGLQRGIPQTNNTSNDCSFFSINNYYYGGDEQYKASMDRTTFNVTVVDLHGNRPVNEDTNGNFVDTTHRTTAVPALATVQFGSHSVSRTFNVLNNSQDGTACGEGSTITLATSLTSANSVTLPNGEQYVFGYDSTLGLINKITYPTGATVTYTWSTVQNAEGVQYHTINNNLGGTCSLQHDWFAITKRVVSYDGVTNAEEQDFTYQTNFPSAQSYKWMNKTTTVTTKDLLRGTSFRTVYNYLPTLPPAESDQPLEDLGYVPAENTIQYYGTDGSLLKTTTKVWQTMATIAAECETLSTGQISGKFYIYQPYAAFNGLIPQPFNHDSLSTDLPTDVAEYDYGQVSSACVQPSSSVLPIRETVTTYQAFPNSPLFAYNALQDRPSTVKVYGNVGGTKTLIAETDYAYDGSTPSPVSPVPYGHDEGNFGSGSAAPRGNPTTVTKKCFVGGANCTNSVTTYTYDTTGQVLSVTDANSNITKYSYSDNYTTDDGTPSNNTNAFVTTITRPVTNGVSHITNFKYGFNDGKLRLVTDENSLQTKYCYWTNGCSGSTFDPFVRLTESDNPDGGRTSISYSDAGLSPSVTTSKTINSSQTVTTIAVSDGLGHPKQTQITTDPQGTVFTDTTYDGLGQVRTQSNPYRTGTDATTTTGTTTFVYDSLGRKTSATYPDNSVLNTAYCGAETLVTDPTKRWRRSRSDALGRLVEVDEPNVPGATVNANGCVGTGEPIWVTSYGYDGLGDLLSVLQNGSHSRSFTYDSLSRLLTSTNPEAGTITYTYDPNSNVSTKKDARNITTTYTYDALNREKTVTYSSGDPTVSKNYDESNCLGLSPCQNVGQRTSMTDASGSEAWSYQVDSTNKRTVHVNQRTTNSETRTATYYLDLAGNIFQMVYPSGRTVNYTFDSANRPSTAKDFTTGLVYATGFQAPPANTQCTSSAVCYTPQGAPFALSVGQSSTFTGLNLNETFNSRLQPNEIKASSTGGNAFDLIYNYTDPVSSGNAGHVSGVTNNLDTTRSQTFAYDQLNRITAAQTTSTHAVSPSHCWGETYALDAWANLSAISATTNSAYTGCSQESGFSGTVDGNNHLGLLNFGYDASGNTGQDGVYNYAWNAESQIVWSSDGSHYGYDGDGRRVSKTTTPEPKLYWYGSGGEILTETNTSSLLITDYVYFGGKRVAQVPNDLNLNGGFEQGLQNWTASGPGTATAINNPANAHSGNQYADLTSPPNTTTTLTTTQPISAQQGETITATAWVYRESGSSFYSRWTLSIVGNGGQCNLAAQPPDNFTMNTWLNESLSIYIPIGCPGPFTVSVSAQIENHSSTQTASARFDDATLNGNTLLFAEDSLGSTRVVTDTSGVVCYDADFYPYGGERPYTNNCTTHYKFEGKERDEETGNDSFGARYYSNRVGRWLSADWSAVPVAVPYANLSNPQTLNLYSLVSDDPESFADLDGHDFEKMFQELKVFAKSLSAKTEVGLGFEAKVEIGKAEAKVGAAGKVSIEASSDSSTLSRSASAGAEASQGSTKVGESASVEQTVLKIGKDGVTGMEKPEVSRTDSSGLFGGNVGSSNEKLSLGLELPAVYLPLVGGASISTTKEGVAALKNAISEFKESMQNPGPPRPKPPSAPPCGAGGASPCAPGTPPSSN